MDVRLKRTCGRFLTCYHTAPIGGGEKTAEDAEFGVDICQQPPSPEIRNCGVYGRFSDVLDVNL